MPMTKDRRRLSYEIWNDLAVSSKSHKAETTIGQSRPKAMGVSAQHSAWRSWKVDR